MPSHADTQPVYTRLPNDQADWIRAYAAEHHMTLAAAFALVMQRGIDETIREENE